MNEKRAYSYVRFSTPEQLKGDSLRRQLEASKAYAEKHGLQLDESLKLQDLGLSAYSGAHRTKGALGEFLKLVKSGNVAKGSVLIIESLDRLSREQVLDALNLFTDIIRSGIRVVTLADGFEYDEESVNKNVGQLIVSLTIMSRAHEESQMKSQRLKAVWENKRKNLDQKKLTSRAPKWLKLAQDRKEFIVIEERAQAVKDIFKMRLAGKGASMIENEMNKNTSWKPKNGWYRSYVNVILRNEAVIGTFQPKTKVDGKYMPTGDPIPNYYPAIINEDLFYKVQHLLKQNPNFGGRNGKVANLFGLLTKCGYCGSAMRLISKGATVKGGYYYYCDSTRRGLGCKSPQIKYDRIENALLTYCKGLHVADILEDDQHQTELKILKDDLTVVNEKLKSVKSNVENLTDRISKTKHANVAEVLEEKLNKIIVERDQLQQDQNKLESEIQKKSALDENITLQLDQVKTLIETMKQLDEDQLIDVRLRLRDKIRGLVDHVNIYAVGVPRMTDALVKETIKEVQQLHPNEDLGALEKELKDRIGDKHLLTVSIFFKTGSIRTIQPYKPEKLLWDFDKESGALILPDMTIK